MEPTITTLTATAITTLAFNEFIKSGTGELAKKSIEGTLDLIKNLRDKIRERFTSNEKAKTAIAELKQQGTIASLEKVSKFLELEMVEDKAFATEIQQLAQQIINIQNQNNIVRQYIIYGRGDQINIENIYGNPKIGGS